MFQFLDAKQVSGVPFVIVGNPISVFKSSYQYREENQWTEHGLPEFLTCYLIDETKAPYAKVKDASGREVPNLVWYSEDKANAMAAPEGGDAKPVCAMSYDFFNYRAPVMRTKPDGTVEQYRRKWLKRLVRCPVAFPVPPMVDVWDKETKSKRKREVQYAKVDVPFYIWERDVESQMAKIRETLEKPDMPREDFQVSVQYDPNAIPAEMYRADVKRRKGEIDLAKAKEELSKRDAEFVPPTNPFSV